MGFVKLVLIILAVPCIYSGISDLVAIISKSFDA